MENFIFLYSVNVLKLALNFKNNWSENYRQLPVFL